MSAYFIRTPLLILVFLFCSLRADAQKFLIPDEAILQHAGSIGFFSAGAGYKLFENERGNLDLLYGYVPASKGGKLHIVTAKFAYKPFVIRLNKIGTIQVRSLPIRHTETCSLSFRAIIGRKDIIFGRKPYARIYLSAMR